MNSSEAKADGLWQSHLHFMQTDPATARSVRTYCALAVPCSLLFIPVEYVVFREHFEPFLALRLASVAVMVGLYFLRNHRHALWGVAFSQMTLGLMVVAMLTLHEKGVASGYAPGLIFVFCVSPIVAPLSVRQVMCANSPVLAAFLVVPQIAHPVGIDEYALHTVLPFISILVGAASASLLNRYRFSEFVRRRELERARDELQKLDAAKSRFTANLHHELRTPLTLILSPLEAMLDGAMGPLPDSASAMLDSMRKNAVRLLKLINNLLDLARIESHQMKIARERVDLTTAVEDIVRGAEGMAQRKGIELSFRVDPGVTEIHADPSALDKVIVNLVGNALKFTDSGGAIRVSLMPLPGGVRICVSDTGIGIPSEQISRVFDRFAQVDTSEGRPYEGTGIGLSLVQELVELHGGKVWAESEGVGHGSQVYVELPIGEPDVEESEALIETGADPRAAAEDSLEMHQPTAPAPLPQSDFEHSVERWERTQSLEESPSEADEPPGERSHVLVVDDNADLRELVRSLLSPEFHVTVARNGVEGLEAVHASHPDIVLSDVMMPGMTGLELTSALKEDATTARIPVILVTSKADREMRVQGLECGADDYVTKPFHPRELQARVRAFARLRRLQLALEERGQVLAATLDELKQAQTQLVHREKMSALGQLVAGVAHEINNPVGFIQGNLEFLETYVGSLKDAIRAWEEAARGDSALQDRVASLVDPSAVQLALDDLDSVLSGVREGAERTTRIVRDLQTFSRLDRSELIDAHLPDCLDSTLNLLAGKLSNIEVVREYDDIPLVSCLSGHLNQVFMNLLSNAADAIADHGRIVVRVGSAGPDRVFVEVEDNGTGIQSDHLDRIMDPFFTTKEVGAGTGLGLAISHGIVERHAGSMAFQTEVGKGTCVRVELPVHPPDDSRSRL